MHGLDLKLKTRLKMACSSSFLLLLLDLFSFPLAISLLLILLGVVFNFGSVGRSFGRELKEAKEENALFVLELSFFLSFCVV